MKITEVELTDSSILVFPDGATAELRYSAPQWGGDKREVLRVQFPTANEIELDDAVDNGETTDYPRIHSIAGSPRESLLLFGGPMAYTISSGEQIIERIGLFRTWDCAEYWSTEFAESSEGLMIVYEAGVLVVNQCLTPIGHIKKRFNDVYRGIHDGKVVLTDDAGRCFETSI